jgi:hypothetical protein
MQAITKLVHKQTRHACEGRSFDGSKLVGADVMTLAEAADARQRQRPATALQAQYISCRRYLEPLFCPNEPNMP